MMIGILTFQFAHNYGAALQAYATKTFLSNCGYDANIIDYYPERMVEGYDINPFHKKGVVCLIAAYEYFRKKYQSELFDEFKNSVLGCISPLRKDELANKVLKYGAVICGSDQIWNTDLTFNDAAYFLNFVPKDVKKIGYGVSMGKNQQTPVLSRFADKYIQDFDALSFREKKGAELIKNMMGLNFPVVVDPVFLLSQVEWKKLERKPKNINSDKFILYYALEENSDLIKATKELSHREQIPIYSIHPLCSKSKVGGTQLSCVGPREFLWLIDHAVYVCSNSFHATAFSMIFAKKAICVAHGKLGDRNRQLFALAGFSENSSTKILDFEKADTNAITEQVVISKRFIVDNLQSIRKDKQIASSPYSSKAYACRHINKKVISTSSSGGVFTALAEWVQKNNGIVVGAGYNYDTNSVEEYVLRPEDDYTILKGSKYIQSSLGETYRKCAELLSNGSNTNLLFIGTACQVVGFRNYAKALNLNMKHIYLVDIICHGTPSPGVWREYLKYKTEKSDGKIDYISFRDKRNNWERPYSFIKQKQVEISIMEFADLFYSTLYLRPSCFKCPYACVDKTTDMTIGDFWGINDVCPEFYIPEGNSLVLVHNQHGAELYNSICGSIESKECSTLSCLQDNLIRPTSYPNQREEAWEFLEEQGMKKILDKYFPRSIHGKVIRKIRRKMQHSVY